MEPNTLLVHIISAKALYLKNHNNIDAYSVITLQGKGSTKSRVQTEVIQCTGDVKWDEHCEFKLNENLNLVTVSVRHKSKLGASDLIGNCEVPLDQAKRLGHSTWLPLKKKKNDEKYRGEIQLQFTFTYEKPNISISTLSLNKIEKDNMLSKMKRKIKMAKQKQADDAMSIASGISSFSVQSSKSNRFMNKLNKTFGGLHKSSTMPRDLNPAPKSYEEEEDNFDSPQFLSPNTYFNAPRPVSATSGVNLSTNGSSLSLSNNGAQATHSTPMFSAMSPSLSTSDFHRGNSLRSNASSGFGSGNQNNMKALRDNDASLSHQDLLVELDSLRLELQVKESQLREVQEYLDEILSRAIIKCPEILAAPVLTKQPKSSRRLF